MLAALNLVKGAVEAKNLVPILTHFHIANGRIQGGNGRITIDAPIALDFDAVVHAQGFFNAVEACGDTEPTITVSDEFVHFKSGKFKCKVPKAANDGLASYPVALPDKGVVLINVPILSALRLLRKFIGEDASRPWSLGAKIRGTYAYGTNNVVIARVLIHIPELYDGINLPNYVIDELLRIGIEPRGYAIDANSITFYYDNDCWLKGQLLSVDAWPAVEEWFTPGVDVENSNMAQSTAVPDSLLSAVERVSAFDLDAKNPCIEFVPEDDTPGRTATGGIVCGNASVSDFQLPAGHYRTEPLKLVLQHATHANFAAYPGRVYWRGNGVEGFMVGIRKA